MALAAVLAFAAGAVVGHGARGRPERAAAERFTAAWARGDLRAMWRLADARTRRTRPPAAFAAAYRAAAATASVARIRFGHPGRLRNGVLTVPATVTTRVWGPLHLPLRLSFVREADGRHVGWGPQLLLPGLRRGERLRRETAMPERAALRFRDNTALAQGRARSSPLGAVASSIAGTLGAAPAAEGPTLRAAGVPPGTPVGLSGLERVFEAQLRGRPGGVLYAGGRVLASRPPLRAPDVRTTIAPRVQAAALEALAGRLGGIVAVRPSTGEVLGAVGIAWSALQPPGSTFKIVTVTGVLEAGLARPSTAFPVQDAATLDGVRLENANGELCGGTLAQAFAASCNSVFAPLGARLGAGRLVDVARRFGFGEAPGIPGAATSSIPPAGEIGGGQLAIGSTAIGQGRVQATALQMALVAATIGERGVRRRPVLRYGRVPAPVRATSSAVARRVGRLMEGVVRFGTGTAAALPGVVVAGKTGTAELKTTVRRPPDPSAPAATVPLPANDPTDTDAWFAGYAPAGPRRHPRVAVGVLLVRAGAGGTTAAPVARAVLAAALGR